MGEEFGTLDGSHSHAFTITTSTTITTIGWLLSLLRIHQTDDVFHAESISATPMLYLQFFLLYYADNSYPEVPYLLAGCFGQCLIHSSPKRQVLDTHVVLSAAFSAADGLLHELTHH